MIVDRVLAALSPYRESHCPVSLPGFTFRIDAQSLREQNNVLTLVRLFLASTVILTHSIERIAHHTGVDWFSPWLGVTIAAQAVDGFFFLSGFLVFRSLARRSLRSFMLARLARMFPGLLVSVVLTVIVGAWLTTAHGLEYLSGPTLRFLIGNLTFTKGYYTLTGIDCMGGPCIVNGALGTLPWEMRCYLALAALSLLHCVAPRRFAGIAALSLALALVWYLLSLNTWLTAHDHSTLAFYIDGIARFWSMFALGCVISIWHDRIALNLWVLVGLVALTVLTVGTPVAFFVRAAMTGYAILYCGFRPWSFRKKIASWPDYSYGIYVYGYPTMQLLAGAFPAINTPTLVALNLAVVVPIAALSWHFVEKPVLDMVRRRPTASPQGEPITGASRV